MAVATGFKFGEHIAYTERKTRSPVSKTRSRGYILNLPTAVNKFITAKAIGFQFSA